MKNEVARLRSAISLLPPVDPASPPLELGHLMVRKLVLATHVRSVGRHYSPRFGTVEWAGGVSRDALYAAHDDPLITRMISQPLELSWPNAAGVTMPYYPDFALVRGGKIVILDVRHDVIPCDQAAELRRTQREEASGSAASPMRSGWRRMSPLSQGSPTCAS